MTGVVTSNRCGTCRKRKVKCDEAKPICGPCYKGGRVCEDPISKVKFAKPKVSGTRRRGPDLYASQTSLAPSRNVTVLTSSTGENIGTFLTMRAGHVRKPAQEPNRRAIEGAYEPCRSPILTAPECLQLILLDTFSSTNVGYRLSCVADYMSSIPDRIGHSAALDAALTCLVQRRVALITDEGPNTFSKQGKLYAKALFSLQDALKDPLEAYSDNTLCAVVLLAQVEILGGGMPEVNYVMHAGGAAKLIEMRGPARHCSKFSKLLLASQLGPAISSAIIYGEDCFLQYGDWRYISFHDTNSGIAHQLVANLEKDLRALPTLIKNLRERDYLNAAAAMDNSDLLEMARRMRGAMDDLAGAMSEYLGNGVDVLEIPSPYDDPMYPTIYEFSSRALADACCCHWGISIVLDTIIARLLPLDSPQSVFDALSSGCIRSRQQLCMSFEYSQRYWPLGAMYMSGPLVMAYHGATSEEKDWIMKALWRMGRQMPGSKEFWGPDRLEISTRVFYGERVNFSFRTRPATNPYAEAWQQGAPGNGGTPLPEEGMID